MTPAQAASIMSFKMISPYLKQLIDECKKLRKENKQLRAESRSHVADLKRLYRECRTRHLKKPKSN
jgi:hypothetical protein